ncbi:MAG: magnesium transporter [Lachnospiraceae bacterium]|nr:magnesium transporter [Lachnospiraceae bacterium]
MENEEIRDLSEELESKEPDNTIEEEVQAKPDYSGEIKEVIRSNASPKALREKLDDYHDNDIAVVVGELTTAERQKLYRVLDIGTLSAILEYAEEDEVAEYLNEMDIRKAAAVISHMEPDVAVDVLREIEKIKRGILIELMDEESRKDIRLLASFDEDEIGSRMTTNYISIHEGLSVKEAMGELIRQAPENDNISTLFVLDGNDTFVGALDLKELIIARQGDRLEDLIMTSYPYVYGHESIDSCIENLKDYSEDLIPVLDNQNTMLGVITSQSIVDVVDEAMGEDYARLAGLTAEEELNEPLKDSLRKRLPWLLVLLGFSMVVSTVIGSFEKVISALTIVMFFQSLILNMSGNAGTQSLAVTIRVLMDENLTGKQKADHVLKEIRVGSANGFLLGAISVIFIGLYIVIIKGRTPADAFAISGCVGLALFVAMIISSCTGSLVPMVFKKMKVDPAVASGPFITTLNDLVGVITYYGLAWLLLIKVLHLGA